LIRGITGQLEELCFLPRPELKSDKMRDLIEDEIRKKWAGF